MRTNSTRRGNSAHHSFGGMTLTMPLLSPQHSILVMYPSKSANSSMVGLKTGMPRCASGSSCGSSHGLASEFGERGRLAPSEQKKWSGWMVLARMGGVTDLDGVREEVRLLDIAGELFYGGRRRRRERRWRERREIICRGRCRRR